MLHDNVSIILRQWGYGLDFLRIIYFSIKSNLQNLRALRNKKKLQYLPASTSM